MLGPASFTLSVSLVSCAVGFDSISQRHEKWTTGWASLQGVSVSSVRVGVFAITQVRTCSMRTGRRDQNGNAQSCS